MATQDNNDFWSSFSQWGPGLLQTAGGWYASNAEREESKKRAGQVMNDPTAQGLNQAQMAELSQVGSADPAQLFAQQQGLMQPVKERGQADLMRDLYKKGMLGLATDQQASAGGAQTWQNAPGTRSNPLAAAYYAAQAGADQKAAFDAINQASRLRSEGVNRVAALGGARQGAMNAATAGLPDVRRSSGIGGMITGLLGNKELLGGIGKLFKSDPNAAGKVGAGQMPGQASGQAQPQYDRTVDDFGGGYNMPTPQIGMDDMYGGGIFSTPAFDFGDLWGGNDYGWNTGWDVGGGLTWSGEYE